MVYQNTIPFGAPSQRRLRMVAGSSETATIAVLDPFNEPQGNLHDMTIPVAELENLAKSGEGSVTAQGPKANITFRTGDHASHYDFAVVCEDVGEGAHTESEVTRSDFEALIATLRP